MWPEPGDGLDQHLHHEATLADLYAEAIRRWSPTVEMAVLPDLNGVMVNGDPALTASTLPPDPDAAVANDSAGAWDHVLRSVILAGMSILWGQTFLEVRKSLAGGHDLPPTAGAADAEIDPAVLRIIKNNTGASAAEVRAGQAAVAASPQLAASREAYLGKHAEAGRSLPGRVRDKIVAGIKALAGTAPEAAAVEVTAQVRARVREIIAPASPEMSDLAREQSYQAAGVMNHAALEAANYTAEEAAGTEVGEDGEPVVMQKVWIATLDAKTRPSHWAADGQRVPLEGRFTVGSADLEFPGDPAGPPEEVCNCRCRVGVLASDEALPDEVDRHTERLDGRDSVVVNRGGRSQQEEIDRRAAQGNTRARDEDDGIGHVAASAAVLDTNAKEDTVTELADATATGGDSYRTFTDAVVALIGESTSDGRMLAADIELSFRDFPLPLMWTRQSSGGHLDAYTVGVLETASVADGKVLASGYLLNTEEANEAAQQIAHGVTGPSVDLAATEWMLTDENGKEITEEQWWDMPMDATVLQTITKAELIGTTLVSTPAFGATKITLNAERESRDAALVASAADEFRPKVYAAGLFDDPKLTGPTLPTMGDDGRIYGHLACFGECHRSIQTQCVLAPRSRSGYRHFHTSPAVRLDNGQRLPVGRLTVGTGHAPDNLRPGPAVEHYDNTGACWALVRVGEDEHGIWFSGVAAPGATAEQIEMGLAAPLSGDWRDFGEGLELIAALSVNTPGFAARGRDDDQGRPIALVASLGPAPAGPAARQPLSREDIKAVLAEALVEREQAAAHAAALVAALARANDLVGPPPVPPTPAEEVAELLAGR